jgi:serine/threonine protein kinase
MVLIFGYVLRVRIPKLVANRRAQQLQTHNSAQMDGYVLIGDGEDNQASIQVYAKILVSHFQVLLQFHIVMDIDWPGSFQQLLDYLAIMKGDIMSYLNIKCALALDLYIEFTVAMLIIPAAILVGVVTQIAYTMSKTDAPDDKSQHFQIQTTDLSGSLVEIENTRQKPDRSSSKTMATTHKNGLLNRVFVLVFCIYPFLTTRIFHMFYCKSLLVDDGSIEKWHRYDFSVNCMAATYLSFRFAAYAMVIVYPLGIPTFVSWIFFKNRERLTTMDISTRKREHAALDTSAQSEWASFKTAWTTFERKLIKHDALPWYYGDRDSFYFLIRDYNPKYYYFEVVEFLRKLLLTGVLMVLDPERVGSVGQILVGIAITFFFATVTAVVQPYADKRANRMRITADASLFVTLQCVLVLHEDVLGHCEKFTPNDVGLLLIFVNFVVLLLATFLELLRRCSLMYNEVQSVGISYAPEKPLGDTSKVTKLYHGMYKATVSATAAPCVVKIRAPEKRLLEMETMIMLQIVHRNVVRIFRTEEHQRRYYLATEVCDCSITEAVESFNIDIGPLIARLHICSGIIDGLNAMHTAGAIHGNITPSNVFLSNEDGKCTPKLGGFSCSTVFNSASIFTTIDTIHGTLGYQPAEVIRGRRVNVEVDVQCGTAVDVFSLGVTMCYLLSGGIRPFYKDNNSRYIEANILAGDHGIADIDMLSFEAKHLLRLMLSENPKARPPMEYIPTHPLFFSDVQKAQYLGETIGNILPSKVERASSPFINALEQAMDDEIGPYNERDPAAGGSWARLLDPKHPVGGWGVERNSQQNASRVEHLYHVYGGNAGKKQEDARAKRLSMGNEEPPKSIRAVGLLKFIRNVAVGHRNQHVERGRFENEEQVIRWCLQPFPWLLATVHRLEMQFGQDFLASSVASAPVHIESNPLELIHMSSTDSAVFSQ